MLITRNVHISQLAIFLFSLSTAISFIAFMPAGVAAQPSPRKLDIILVTI